MIEYLNLFHGNRATGIIQAGVSQTYLAKNVGTHLRKALNGESISSLTGSLLMVPVFGADQFAMVSVCLLIGIYRARQPLRLCCAHAMVARLSG